MKLKKILNFCELEWDEKCLSPDKNSKTPIKTVSVSQARQPIYKSSLNSNQNYDKYLEKMFSIIKIKKLSNLKKINYLISQKKFSEVELIITKLLLEDSRNQELLLLLGGCYRSLGKLDKAKETYFKIIQINPTNTVSQRLIIDYLST